MMQPLHHCKHLLDQLNKQRQEGFLCDCTVVIGQTQFRAHMNVLAAFSEYFGCQSGNPDVNSVTFLDPTLVNPSGFQKLLDYVYTGNINIDGEDAIEIHKAATYLKIEAVTARCKLNAESGISDVKLLSKEILSAVVEPEKQDVGLSKPSDLRELAVVFVSQDQAPPQPENTEVFLQVEEKGAKKARKPKTRHGTKAQQRRNCQPKEKQTQKNSPSLLAEAFSDASNKTTELAVQMIQGDEEPHNESSLGMDTESLPDQNAVIQKSVVKKGKSRKLCTLKENCASDPLSEDNADSLDSSEAEGLSEKQLKMKPVCNTCGKVFSEASSLRRHMRIHKGVKPYVCQLCEKAFTQCNQLKTHVRTHTGEKPYQCDTCDKGFAQKCQLVFHSRMHHGEEKPYKCDICGLQFATSSNLKIHSRKHSGEKPYVCERCGQRFAQASTLTYHVRRHTGEKPYICDTCGKAFAVSSSLITHARKHTGEKPYACRTCGKRFISSGELNKHCRSHTGEKPFVCELCGNSYTDVKNLKKHKAKAHGVERNLDPSISSGAFVDTDTLGKESLQDTTQLKPADIPLSLTLPMTTEDQQILLSATDSSSISSDQVLRSTVTGYSEPQFIFLQQLY
ncbi:myoneurin [Acipenser ruthenus]|uniref:myoneurin n=1 Tax=Acipenser ruthenus TaxID=7906 RepID=UPI0027409D1E|nr:myoneurin [Acipenser ruthenus]